MRKEHHYHCPVNAWDCPYYKDHDEDPDHGCLCTLENPVAECDDFYAMWGDCDPEDYTDYKED